jgi:hypothetical protein
MRGAALALAAAAVGCGESRGEVATGAATATPTAVAAVSPRFAGALTRAERQFARAVARADEGRLTWTHFHDLADEFKALQGPLTAVRATGEASRARYDAADIAQQAMQRAVDFNHDMTMGRRPSLDRFVADLHRLQLGFELALERAPAAVRRG